MIVEAKERYTDKLNEKLDDISTMEKAYWSILNPFLNSKKKKTPNIPQLNVNGKIISNFEKKRGFSIHTLHLNALQLLTVMDGWRLQI